MDEVKVKDLPKCDFCELRARYDAKTIYGVWANMCLLHWKKNARYPYLGIGIGQKLLVSKQ